LLLLAMQSRISSSNRPFLQRYFDEEAKRYDVIYEKNKPFHQRFIDNLFRRVILKRFSLVIDRCGDVKEKNILDVGCGSGRYSLELASKGAHVVGIDISRKMLSLAEERARILGLTNCIFIQGDFLDMDFKTTFDIVLSIGVFDYFNDPAPFLSKILYMTKGQAIISFPRRLSLRAIPRKIRLFLRGCPVRFYSIKEIEGLFSSTGREGTLELYPLSRDIIAFYKMRGDGCDKKYF